MIIFKIHILYWVMAFICAFTGLFKNFIFFSLLIIIHELGHFCGACLCKWKVKKIIILPIGGLTVFDEFLSKSIFEEFIILVLGPLFQIIFYYSYTYIFGFNALLHIYNYALLVFNLLPIYPLDGYKLLNLIFNKIFSFKISHLITMIISLVCLFFISILSTIYKANFILVLAFITLFVNNIKELFSHNLLFNKFLLERYLYDINFRKSKIINSDNYKKMYREYKHIFFYDKKYETEKSFLKKKFDINKKLC